VFYCADKCCGMRGICGNGGRAAAGRYVPPPFLRRGYGGFWGRTMRGWLWGSKGRQGPGDCVPYHTGMWLLFGGNCAPALIPLVQPGKGQEARSVVALRPFVLALLPRYFMLRVNTATCQERGAGISCVFFNRAFTLGEMRRKKGRCRRVGKIVE
jgi:hypothetical protein